MAVPATGSTAPLPCGFGWDGGTGTTWRSNPRSGVTGILFTQRAANVARTSARDRRLLGRGQRRRHRLTAVAGISRLGRTDVLVDVGSATARVTCSAGRCSVPTNGTRSPTHSSSAAFYLRAELAVGYLRRGLKIAVTVLASVFRLARTTHGFLVPRHAPRHPTNSLPRFARAEIDERRSLGRVQ